MENRLRARLSAGLLVTLVAAVAGPLGSASAEKGASGSASAEKAGHGPIVGSMKPTLSAPVRSLPPSAGRGAGSPPPRINPLADEPGGGSRGTRNRGEVPRDPLSADSVSSRGTPGPSLTFEGTGNPAACSGCTPPDTVGDVGPNHYVQMVNATKVAIFNKSGTLLQPIFNLGSLWSSVGGACNSNAGDPIPAYDSIADRWVLSQFAFPNHLCFAVSTTPDPQGTYFLYTANVGQFPDYFKVGVWPRGYFVSANEASYTAYAFERAKMLLGQTATFIKFTGQTNMLLPLDVDGPAPPSTLPGIFYTFKDNAFHGGADRLEFFTLSPDYANPANSTFTLARTFTVPSFTYTVCGFFDLTCIQQPGTSQRIDAVSEWPMHRFVYRRVGGIHRALGNFTVDGAASEQGAGIRWFEMRATTPANATIFQQGTHDPPDNHDRFMGSIAMDRNGNIALGYSVSSTAQFPSIRYAVRTPSDPLGTLQSEATLINGGGSQTGSSRWGDYSAMNIDPDGCTFWYTNEYYPVNSTNQWKTRIGRFVMPGCTR